MLDKLKQLFRFNNVNQKIDEDIINLVLLIGQITTHERFNKITHILEDWMIDYNIQTSFKRRNMISNIIIPSVNKYNKITLIAHYDVVDGSNGYIDNACSIVCLLLMKKQGLLPPNVEVLFSDCEEYGQVGARAYYDTNMAQTKAIINLDVIGYGTQIYYMHNNPIFIDFVMRNSMMPAVFPICDYYVFNKSHIYSISLTTGDGPNWNSTENKVMSLMHHGKNDNRIKVVNPKSIELVMDTIQKLLKLF